MKLKISEERLVRGQKLVAQFGQAALIKQPDGTWQLKGGSQDDRHSAREWISLFMHEAIVSCR
jgi:hypothetical protein